MNCLNEWTLFKCQRIQNVLANAVDTKRTFQIQSKKKLIG